jgi:Holliday junction resolvase
MTNSRDKGARGEREWAKWMTENIGLFTRRGRQYSGNPDSPDVVGGIPGTHCEVKRVERLNIYEAMDQAVGDAGEKIPYVAHRRNRREWLITLRAQDLDSLSWRVTDREKLQMLEERYLG